MTLVDATMWIDYLAGIIDPRTAWLHAAFDDEAIGLTDLTLCEVLQGLRSDIDYNRTKEFLSRFELISTGGEALAIASAQNCRFLRKRGITVRKTIDCIIASLCIREGYSLLHNDRDFVPFEQHLNLRVIHPPPLNPLN